MLLIFSYSADMGSWAAFLTGICDRFSACDLFLMYSHRVIYSFGVLDSLTVDRLLKKSPSSVTLISAGCAFSYLPLM